jgi:hypothetical protein
LSTGRNRQRKNLDESNYGAGHQNSPCEQGRASKRNVRERPLRGLTMATIFGEQCSGFKAGALRRNTGGHENQTTSKAAAPSKLQVWIEVKG